MSKRKNPLNGYAKYYASVPGVGKIKVMPVFEVNASYRYEGGKWRLEQTYLVAAWFNEDAKKAVGEMLLKDRKIFEINVRKATNTKEEITIIES